MKASELELIEAKQNEADVRAEQLLDAERMCKELKAEALALNSRLQPLLEMEVEALHSSNSACQNNFTCRFIYLVHFLNFTNFGLIILLVVFLLIFSRVTINLLK